MFPLLAMRYTKYPQACKALMAFMVEAENFNPWLLAAGGYLTPLLERLRCQSGLDFRSETHPIPRCREAFSNRRRTRLGWRKSRERNRRFCPSRHVCRLRNRPRRRQRRHEARRAAASAHLSLGLPPSPSPSPGRGAAVEHPSPLEVRDAVADSLSPLGRGLGEGKLIPMATHDYGHGSTNRIHCKCKRQTRLTK